MITSVMYFNLYTTNVFDVFKCLYGNNQNRPSHRELQAVADLNVEDNIFITVKLYLKNRLQSPATFL